ncbi:MarR family transcriptional regulator [Roseomonas sp. NAR14]|uniref:MarR family transcriptional regulator n=1 Tax=Roseomonas acroporae TaxID=2937791 RepID=A0A9X1Y959_9PROT|nr:MarR family transcriptional regulator [Roseomonas acroporae]MCK8786189.1 MarR family transcriptional regulator [Roseomonas acroporae]
MTGESANASDRLIDDFLPYLLARASHVVSAEFHGRLRGLKVSAPKWRVLAALSSNDGETVSGLAESCMLQQPTMTKLLDRMVRDRLVTRAPDARDRRVVRISLTERGRAAVSELLSAAQRHEAELFARHSSAEGDVIKAALRSLIGQHDARRRG